MTSQLRESEGEHPVAELIHERLWALHNVHSMDELTEEDVAMLTLSRDHFAKISAMSRLEWFVT
jgi:hypothetical protein